jgi:hypothetical protein
MALYACPNCGLTESTPVSSPEPGPCPRCCARLHPSSEISWQRLPPLPFPTDRPRLRLALAPTTQAPALARRAIDGLREELSEHELFTARLLISELVSNVVLHAADTSPPRATATVWVSPERLRVDVLDCGAGFRPRVGSTGELRESGWGLPLVAELAHAWGVVPGHGSWVWFELLRAAVQPAAGKSTRRSARMGTSGASVELSNRSSSSSPSEANESRTSPRYSPSTTAALRSRPAS